LPYAPTKPPFFVSASSLPPTAGGGLEAAEESFWGAARSYCSGPFERVARLACSTCFGRVALLIEAYNPFPLS